MRNADNSLNANKKERGTKGKPYYFHAPVSREHKKRLCLTCGKRFLSKCPHNRICVNCSLDNKTIRADVYSVSFGLEELTHGMEEHLCELIETFSDENYP